jgi:hypothetical protein
MSLAVKRFALGPADRHFGVDLRRFAVGMAKKLLDHAQWLAGGCQASGKRVPQVVKLDLARPRGPASRLEPLAELMRSRGDPVCG